MDEPGKGSLISAQGLYGRHVSGSEKISVAVWALLSPSFMENLVFQGEAVFCRKTRPAQGKADAEKDAEEAPPDSQEEHENNIRME